MPEYGDHIDQETFEQILEMDDEGESSFSQDIVWKFFEQAESTFRTMKECLASRDLKELSQLGHFLKGSSATLGLSRVKDSCEKIQNFGSHLDATGNKPEPDDDVCLKRIEQTLKQLEEDYRKVEELLRDHYGEAAK
ncbi:MAG: hypothetical protein M1816_006203 [Peltula sp. TS41687]|nr:MAG: hypothetical protein M1816_006203 [Peltula sp. TS41687]